jgi:hypothetical protein
MQMETAGLWTRTGQCRVLHTNAGFIHQRIQCTLLLLDDHSIVGLILRGSAAQRTIERAPLLYELEHANEHVRPASYFVRQTRCTKIQEREHGGIWWQCNWPESCTTAPLCSWAGTPRMLSVASELRQRKVKLSVLHVRFDDRDGEWGLLPEASQHRDRCAASSRQHLQVLCRRRPG